MEFFKSLAGTVTNLVFQMAEERFDGRIVEAIALSGHRLDHLHLFDVLYVEGVRVMGALVRMDHGIFK